MGIAWNWIGVLAWALIIIYLIGLAFYIRSSNKQALKKSQRIARRCGITVQVILLLLMVGGMSFLHFSAFNHHNIRQIKTYSPVVLDTNGDHSYYVIVKYNNANHPKHYSYLTNGRRDTVSLNNATLRDEKKVTTVPHFYGTSKDKIKELDSRYQRAWTIRIVSKYKDNWLNGLALRANGTANLNVLIRVPDHSFVHEHH